MTTTEQVHAVFRKGERAATITERGSRYVVTFWLVNEYDDLVYFDESTASTLDEADGIAHRWCELYE